MGIEKGLEVNPIKIELVLFTFMVPLFRLTITRPDTKTSQYRGKGQRMWSNRIVFR